MRSDYHHISSVLSTTEGPLFVTDRRSVAAFVRQLPESDSDFLALLVDDDLRLLDALKVWTCGSRFPAQEIMHRGSVAGAAGIILVKPKSGGQVDVDMARLASVALQEACCETDMMLLDCLLVTDGQVHSLTGLDPRPRPQQRLADNPWSRR